MVIFKSFWNSFCFVVKVSSHLKCIFKRLIRIELTLTAWKAVVLPLNHRRVVNWYSIVSHKSIFAKSLIYRSQESDKLFTIN